MVLAALAAIHVSAAGFLGATRAAPQPQPRAPRVSMMPSSTPLVPYKYPGMDSPQWGKRTRAAPITC